MAIDRDPYLVLGVARDASESEIRDAYRRLARRLHPDVAGDAGSTGPTGPTMAEVNAAWSTLSDPARRRAHDAERERSSSDWPPSGHGTRVGEHGGAGPVVLEPLARPRIPWRLMLGIVVIGSAAVLTAHANTRPAPPGAPDQLIQAGSCVDIDDTSAAVEVRCDGPHEGVVRQLIAFDRACPQDTSSHRDRQGMGIACVDLVEVQPGDGSG
ncbi:MAG: J domain-containing protein [Actinomycetota bacterium]